MVFCFARECCRELFLQIRPLRKAYISRFLSFQLEADILRLTTRLMMRERDLRRAQHELEEKFSRSQQSAQSWRSKVKQRDDQLRVLLREKDQEMDLLVSRLVLLETQLRKEQLRIENVLQEKDAIIKFQRRELVRLKQECGARKEPHLGYDDDQDVDTSDLPPPPQLEMSTVSTQTVNCEWYCADKEPFWQHKSIAAVQRLRSDLIRGRSMVDLTSLNTGKRARPKHPPATRGIPQPPTVIINILRKSGDSSVDAKTQFKRLNACDEKENARNSDDQDSGDEKNSLRIEDITALHDPQNKRKALYIQRHFNEGCGEDGKLMAPTYHVLA